MVFIGETLIISVKGIIMMKCPKCGEEISPNAKFCKYCGTKAKQALYCENCGAELADDSVFCPECGQKVSSETTEESEKSETPTPAELNYVRSEPQAKKPETNDGPSLPRSSVKTEEPGEQPTACTEQVSTERKGSSAGLTMKKKKFFTGKMIACVVSALCLVILILVLILVSQHNTEATDKSNDHVRSQYLRKRGSQYETPN